MSALPHEPVFHAYRWGESFIEPHIETSSPEWAETVTAYAHTHDGCTGVVFRLANGQLVIATPKATAIPDPEPEDVEPQDGPDYDEDERAAAEEADDRRRDNPLEPGHRRLGQ